MKLTAGATIHQYRPSDEEEKDDCRLSIGEDTDHELSLSRHDDSDLSEESEPEIGEENNLKEDEHKEVKMHAQEERQLPQESANRQLEHNGGAGTNTQMNVVSGQPNVDNVHQAAEAVIDNASDSEPIESSQLDEESEYDDRAQKAEERRKLEQILTNKNLMNAKNGQLSKGQLPYEILINKLIDGLQTPEMIKNKQLPMP